MATTTIYQRLIKRLTATAAFGLLTATSQAGLFCDWNLDHKRPYCSPACEQAWGYHDTCWRQFPPTEPCTDWGAHCSASATGGGFNYGNEMNPGLNAGGPYTGVPMVPQIQQPLMMQQPMAGQNYQMQGAPVMNGAPQGNWNSYNANPAPVPPSGQMDQQSGGSRTFGPASPSGQQPAGGTGSGMGPSGGSGSGFDRGPATQGGSGTRNSVPQGNDQLQLPGQDGDSGDFQLPAIPELSRTTPYYNQGAAGQGYGNQYQQVSQSNMTGNYGQPLLYPSGNAAAAYSGNGTPNQQPFAQPQYGQQQYGVQPQQAYAQPMQQQQMMAPGYPQPGSQFQAPQPGAYPSQPAPIQVVPGRQPSVTGVSFSRSIRPASNNMNMQQPMPVQKQSFLSKINPFSK